MLGLVGARGTGKTTLVLQHYLAQYGSIEKCLYFSADNPLVLKSGLYETVQEYFAYYGECVIIDEVHKYPDWSVVVKALYDSYPGRKIIVLGSSALGILNEKGDLSRRMLVNRLPVLSLREYLMFRYGVALQAYSLPEILEQHVEIASSLRNKIPHILKAFEEFIAFGNFPFCIEFESDAYLQVLANTLDKILYEDIPNIQAIRGLSSLKMKKLLGYLSSSTIPLFNTETLCKEIEVSKDTLYEYFDLLQRADVVQVIRIRSKKQRAIKNSKILFQSPNYYHAIAGEFWKNSLQQGNILEAFFASQLAQSHDVYTSRQLDFEVVADTSVIEVEVGGKQKGTGQLRDIGNGYVFKHGIEVGARKVLPLYLAGFLY